jgi:hypothetical protein
MGHENAPSSSQFSFDSRVWEWEGPSSWHFVSLPEDLADLVGEAFAQRARGFRSLRVEVTIEAERWRTSIFPDSKRGTYLLPVKKEIRQRLGLGPGSDVSVGLTIL